MPDNKTETFMCKSDVREKWIGKKKKTRKSQVKSAESLVTQKEKWKITQEP